MVRKTNVHQEGYVEEGGGGQGDCLGSVSASSGTMISQEELVALGWEGLWLLPGRVRKPKLRNNGGGDKQRSGVRTVCHQPRIKYRMTAGDPDNVLDTVIGM